MNSNPETQTDLGKVKMQLTKLRRVLRETKQLKPHSAEAIEAIDIEVLKTSGEEKKRIKCKYATALYRHGQLLALETRLLNQIYKLNEQKEKLEQAKEGKVLNE